MNEFPTNSHLPVRFTVWWLCVSDYAFNKCTREQSGVCMSQRNFHVERFLLNNPSWMKKCNIQWNFVLLSFSKWFSVFCVCEIVNKNMRLKNSYYLSVEKRLRHQRFSSNFFFSNIHGQRTVSATNLIRNPFFAFFSFSFQNFTTIFNVLYLYFALSFQTLTQISC